MLMITIKFELNYYVDI